MKSIKKASELLKFPAYTPGVSGPMPSSALRPNADIVPLSGTHVEHLLHVDPTMEPDFRCRNKYRTHFYLLEEPDRVTNAINLRSIFDEYVGYDSNEKGMCSHTTYVEDGLRGLYINSTVTYVSTAYTTKVTGTKIEVDCDLMTVSKSTVDKYHVWSNLALDARVMCSSHTQGVTKMDLDNRFLYQAPVTHQAAAACSTIITGIILQEATPVNLVIWIATAHPYASDILSSVLGTSTHMIVFTHKFYSAEAHLCFGGYYFLAGPSFSLISQSITGALVWGVVVSSIHRVLYPSHLLHFWAQKSSASILDNQLQHDNQLLSQGLVHLVIASQDATHMRIMSINSCILLDFTSADMFSTGHRTLIDRMFSNFNECCGSQSTGCQVIKRLTTHPPLYALFALIGVGTTFRWLNCGVYYYMSSNTHRCVYWLERRLIGLQHVILKMYGEPLHDNMGVCANCCGFSIDNVVLIGQYALFSRQSSGMTSVSFSGDKNSVDISGDFHLHQNAHPMLTLCQALVNSIGCRAFGDLIPDFSGYALLDVHYTSGRCVSLFGNSRYYFPGMISHYSETNGELVQHLGVCVYRSGHRMGGAIRDHNDLSSPDDPWFTCVFLADRSIYIFRQYDDPLFDKTSIIWTVCHAPRRLGTSAYDCCTNTSRPGMLSNYGMKGNIPHCLPKLTRCLLKLDYIAIGPQLQTHMEHYKIVQDNRGVSVRYCMISITGLVVNQFDSTPLILLCRQSEIENVGSSYNMPPPSADNEYAGNASVIIPTFDDSNNRLSITIDGNCHLINIVMDTNPCLPDLLRNFNGYISDHTFSFLHQESSTSNYRLDHAIYLWKKDPCDSCTSYGSNNLALLVYHVRWMPSWKSIPQDDQTSTWAASIDRCIYMDLANDPTTTDISNDLRMIDSTAVVYGEYPLEFIIWGFQANYDPLYVEIDSANFAGVKAHPIVQTNTAPHYLACYHRINTRCLFLPMILLPHDTLRSILPLRIATNFRSIGYALPEHFSRYSHDQKLSNHDQVDQIQLTTKLQVTTIPSHNDVDVAPSFGVVQYLCFVRATVFGLDCRHLPLTIDNCLIKWGALWGAIFSHVLSSRGVSNLCRFVSGYVTNTYV